MEKQDAEASGLPPSCHGPQTHLHAGCQQRSETNDGVVDGVVDGVSARIEVTRGFAVSLTVRETLKWKLTETI